MTREIKSVAVCVYRVWDVLFRPLSSPPPSSPKATCLKFQAAGPYTLSEKFWRISLYVTDGAIAKLYVDFFRQIEGNWSKILSHRAISKSVIS